MTKQIDETTGLDISPLIEWAHPNEVAAQQRLNQADKPRSEEEEIKIAKGEMHGDYKGHRAEMRKKHNITEGSDEDLSPEDFETDVFNEAVLVQPVDDLNEVFEVVRGVEGVEVGDTLTTEQIDTLREMGTPVIEQTILEANYHVHAEVSPKGIPLTHNHRIPINAKSEAEAKSKARKHAKERGWKIHSINKVTLAEDADDSYDLVEELDDQSEGPKTFSEITAPLVTELSTKTLKSYVNKAGRDIGKDSNKVADLITKHGLDPVGTHPRDYKWSKDPEYPKLKAHMQKRADGQTLARKKVAAAGLKVPASLKEDNQDTTPKEQLDESWGVKVHHFDDFKRNAEDYASAKTSHGKVEYQHHVAGPFGDKIPAWHQTSAIVDHPRHGRINIGTFNHKHGPNSPHGHGQVLDSYMADDDD